MYIEFVPGGKHAPKNADISDTHESFQDCGWIIQDDEVIIDIDNLPKETLKKMIETFNIKTQTVWTDRGVHLYFRKPEGYARRPDKLLSPLGFYVEPKYSTLKSRINITIKQNGTLRKIENEGVRELLPHYFDKKVKGIVPLLGLSDGDGRNTALFNHRRNIEHLPDWRKIITFINNYIFEEPIPESELAKTALRDGSFGGHDGGEYQDADLFMSKYKTVRFNGDLYYRQGKNYIVDDPTKKNLHRDIYNMVGVQPTRYVDEVYKQVSYRTKEIAEDTLFVIRFKNGVLKEGEFIEIEYEDFTPYNIDIEYDPLAKPDPLVDEYIDKLTGHEPEYRKLLLEILGHTLIVNRERKRSLGMFAIFVGDGGNGKGTLLEIIRNILGFNNCTALSVKDMSKESYFTTMVGKLANLGDDIHDKPIDHEEMKMLKNISTCDVIQGRELFKMSQTITPTVTLIFTSNHDIKTFEKGQAYKRRVKWLPMFSKPEKIDPNFISDLTTPSALKYWVRLIVEGYMRLYKNKKFTESESVNQFNETYHLMNDGAAQFLSDLVDPEKGKTIEDLVVGKTISELFVQFEAWAIENDVDPKRKMLTNALKEHYGLVSKPIKKNGVTRREFVPIERGV